MTAVAKAPNVSELDIEAEFLVFDGEHLHRLTGPAADVWRAVQDSVEVEDVVQQVQGLHPGDPRVPGDVRAFLENLLAEGLLTEQPRSSKRFTIPPYVAWCHDAHGSAVIADLRSGERFQLSAVAASIWSAVDLPQPSRDSLQAALVNDFPDAPDDVEQVIDDLLESLVEVGLLLAPPGSEPNSR